MSLRYSTDAAPGISRIVRGDSVEFRHPNGSQVRSARTLQRIASLVIPPAWTDVWICPFPEGHLQATGKDARGRKQYRYHSRWIAERDADKFDSLLAFARALPRIRRRIAADLKGAPLAKPSVLAAIVQLMDRVFIRVGGERYRRENGSFGATTLRNRHVKVDGSGIFLDFRGKSGKRQRLALDDRRVAGVIRECLELPGAALFQYREGDEIRLIAASDVNAYLNDIAGVRLTSKDFRTWGGTVCAAASLARSARPAATAAERRAALRQAVKEASAVLGNTPAVCRRSYIHPLVLAEGGRISSSRRRRTSGLRASEHEVLALLERHASGAASGRPAQRRRPSPVRAQRATPVSAPALRQRYPSANLPAS